MRALRAVAVLALLLPLAGCTTPSGTPDDVPVLRFRVEANGQPVPDALVSAFYYPSADGVGTHEARPPIRILNADAKGEFLRTDLPKDATYVVARADGLGAGSAGTSSAPLSDEERRSGVRIIELTQEMNAFGSLGFKPHVDLLCTTPDNIPNPPDPTLRYDCGAFGEPVVEVAGDGAIWASATCCVYKAPPIWVSRDEGETFQQLRNADTGLVRDGYGIEGDFAIDDAGNVYFFDIALAATWFTSYKADGTHRWTLPWPGLPLVDRPWVRAGAADEVWIFYNTGSETNVYASTDGGLSWSATPVVLPCALGNPGQGPTRHDFVVAASCGNTLTVWSSHDGAKTFDAGVKVTMPDVEYKESAGRGLEVMNPPVVDEAGNVYLPFTHFVDAKNEQNAIFMARRDPAGNWTVPVQVGPVGMNRLPWPAAGRAGHVGLAWYHSDGKFTKEDEAQWRLWAAASVDADQPDAAYQAAVADHDVLLTGAYGRELGDFIEADLTPTGRLVAVYAGRDESGQLTNRFVQTDGSLSLAPLVFLNGPRPAAS